MNTVTFALYAKRYNHYIHLGTFATREEAERYAAFLNERHPDWTFHIVDILEKVPEVTEPTGQCPTKIPWLTTRDYAEH